jgi:hypothetical protein
MGRRLRATAHRTSATTFARNLFSTLISGEVGN